MVLTLIALLAGPASAEAALLPVCSAGMSARDQEPMVGTVRWTARLALRSYQEVISPADGRSCRFFPSCSTYMVQAVHRHGPLLGVVMGLGRLQRNHDGWWYQPCRMEGAVLLADPVEANDWWFRRRPVGSAGLQETP